MVKGDAMPNHRARQMSRENRMTVNRSGDHAPKGRFRHAQRSERIRVINCDAPPRVRADTARRSDLTEPQNKSGNAVLECIVNKN